MAFVRDAIPIAVIDVLADVRGSIAVAILKALAIICYAVPIAVLLTSIGKTVAIAIRIAFVRDAVAVTVIAVQLTTIRNAVAVAILARSVCDVAGVEDPVGVAVGLAIEQVTLV